MFEIEASLIRSALGPDDIRVEHTGSTSVPGLAAKPVIDISLAVPDSTDESSYVGRLESVGYRLHLREPDLHEHRLLKKEQPAVNLHVFTTGSIEVDRMVLFRDILVGDRLARERYQRLKTKLSEQTWGSIQEYADAKSAVVEEIVARGAQPD